ncbi:MAG: sugar transferase [Muribaculaceae bacterium]|nr:sugar transferase [Muribaculaceae bacterium]
MNPDTSHRTQFVITDLILSSVAWFLFSIIRFHTLAEANGFVSLSSYLTFHTVLIGQILIPLGMTGIYWLSGFYNHTFSKSRLEIILTSFSSVLIGAIFIYFGIIVDDPIPDRLSNYLLMLILMGIFIILILAGRLTINHIIRRNIASGKCAKRMLIVGDYHAVEYCFKRLCNDNRLSGIKIAGLIITDNHYRDGINNNVPVYQLETLRDCCDLSSINGLIIATDREKPESLLRLVKLLYPFNIPLLLPSWSSFTPLSKFRVKHIIGEPLTYISTPSFTESGRNIKRLVDIIISLPALIILSPAILFMSIAVKLSSPGSIFYTQERVGRNRVPFTIYKFRTMITDSEPDGPALSSEGDPRITRLGQFMRKYRLDEIPQFWNVLKGDMSLVGPRPEREYYEKLIIARAPEYTLLHQLRPGITSWGMVKYGYASNIDQMIERLDYDMIYLDNVSLLVDLKIMFYTLRTVITGRGV